MRENIAEFFSKLINVCQSFSFKDFLDICLVAFVIYNLIKMLRETRAFQLIKGIMMFGLVYIVISALNMQASTYLANLLISNLIVVLVIIFQPELRHTLESTGRSSIAKIKDQIVKPKNTKAENESVRRMIESFSVACSKMSEGKIGSLTVFERTTLLGEVIANGTIIDAAPTSQMFCNIFYPKAPLHDGAAIVRKDRIYAAGCILPLTQKNNDVDKNLGTRHRAAIGMSEQSDAVVVVTSEETGAISVAYKGTLKRELDPEKVSEILTGYLIDSTSTEEEKPIFIKLIDRVKGGGKQDGKK